jgi:hypothetical protein
MFEKRLRSDKTEGHYHHVEQEEWKNERVEDGQRHAIQPAPGALDLADGHDTENGRAEGRGSA